MKISVRLKKLTLLASTLITAIALTPHVAKAQGETEEARDERMMQCFFAPPQADPATQSEMEKAAWAENPDAQFDMGRLYYQGAHENHKLAFYWFCKAGVHGHPFAEYMVAYMYLQGDAVPASEEKAVWWLRQAASRGNPNAEYELGYLAERVEAVVYPDTYKGPAPDYVAARKWYLEAANHDYAPAERQLGALYLSNRGGPPDPEQAVYWLTKAAYKGDAQAQYLLGDAYFRGTLGPADKITGYAWVYQAYLSGGQLGALYSNLLLEMEKGMTSDQLLAGKAKAGALNNEIQDKKLSH